MTGFFGEIPDGARFRDIGSVHPEDGEKFERLCEVIEQADPGWQATELRFTMAKGDAGRQAMRWVYCQTGRIEFRGRTAVLVVLDDMTRMKDLEQIVSTREKLSIIGQMAAGIAHEIRNPLSGININVSTLEHVVRNLETVSPEERRKIGEIVAQAKAASEKIATVIRRVMDFTKPVPPKLDRVDVNQVVREALEFSSATLRKGGIEVGTSPVPGPSQVHRGSAPPGAGAAEPDHERGPGDGERERPEAARRGDRPGKRDGPHPGVRQRPGGSGPSPGEDLRPVLHDAEDRARDRADLQPPRHRKPRGDADRLRKRMGRRGIPDRAPSRDREGHRMTLFSVFVVEDEESVRYGIALALEGKYRVRAFPDAESAIAALGEGAPDLVLMDIGLPGMNGIEALKTMKGICPDLVGLVITAYEDVPTVVSAMKAGAFDYVLKPLHAETLEIHVMNALETVRLKKEVRDLQERYLRDNVPLFIGQSHAVREVMEFVTAVAKSPDTPVLIEGETGTGKELIAAAIHYRSPHFKGPIVGVNCAAIPRELIESELFGYEKGAFSGASAAGKKGLVEQAAGGTLFLDEVGDLSPEAQAKLLRFLEEGEFYRVGGTRVLTVSARVVSATNKDLRGLIGQGHFREDLYYRLAVVKVGIPSLNERREDILPIAHHYLVEFGRKFGKPMAGIARDAEEALTVHRWKGNVRELKNVIERAVLMGKGQVVTREDLGITRAGTAAATEMSAPGSLSFPPVTLSGIDLDSLQESFDRYYIHEALRLAGGNESRAASLLNINHHTFRYRKKKLGA